MLDCSPGALKILHNSNEFMPYVVFLAAPGKILGNFILYLGVYYSYKQEITLSIKVNRGIKA